MDELDTLLGFSKPIREMNDEELFAVLRRHFPTTRAMAKDVDSLMDDPLFKGDPVMAAAIKSYKDSTENFKLI